MANFGRTVTASEAVSSVLKTMGLPVPASVVTSTDKTVVQMLALATEAGQKLCNIDGYRWQFLSKEFTITTVPGTQTYALPEDFDGFIGNAQWNRTTRLPAIGSLEQEEWQMLEARMYAGTAFTVFFRVADNVVEFYDDPSTAQTIVMPYQSRGWVESSAGVAQDNIILNDDMILFDPQLFKDALRLSWYEAKEFDTAKVGAAFGRSLSAAKAKDRPARNLSLAGVNAYPLLGTINIPDSGYGS